MRMTSASARRRMMLTQSSTAISVVDRASKCFSPSQINLIVAGPPVTLIKKKKRAIVGFFRIHPTIWLFFMLTLVILLCHFLTLSKNHPQQSRRETPVPPPPSKPKAIKHRNTTAPTGHNTPTQTRQLYMTLCRSVGRSASVGLSGVTLLFPSFGRTVAATVVFSLAFTGISSFNNAHPLRRFDHSCNPPL